jgi:two-component system response regulator LytT
MKIAIVEDNDAAASLLSQYLKKFSEEVHEVFQLDIYPNGFDFLEGFHAQYAVVFMDIEMPMMNGMETSRKLRSIDNSVLLVFVTNMAQFALQGYEVQGFDFIVKPLNQELFEPKMKRIYKAAHEKENDPYITLSRRQGIRKIALRDLLYVEVRGHEITYHLAQETLSQYGTMKEAEKSLPKESFSRCNNPFLIHLAHLSGVEGEEAVLSNGERLKISRHHRKDFLKDYADYLGGHV